MSWPAPSAVRHPVEVPTTIASANSAIRNFFMCFAPSLLQVSLDGFARVFNVLASATDGVAAGYTDNQQHRCKYSKQ
jgi:hypothetical protein